MLLKRSLSFVPRFSQHGRAEVSGAGSGADQGRHLPGERSGQPVRESRSAERDQPALGAKVCGPTERRQAVPQGGPDPGEPNSAARRHRHLEIIRQTERCVRSFVHRHSRTLPSTHRHVREHLMRI